MDSAVDEKDDDKLSSLEEEFKKLYEDVNPQIQEHLKNAMNELEKALELSEKHGIPFYAELSPLGQHYLPASCKVKENCSDTFSDWLEEQGIYINGYYAGWGHSAVC